METLATVVGFASGFALMGYHRSPIGLLATSLAVDAALAPLTVVIAIRHGRPAGLWTLLGLAFGMWALAAVLLLRPVRKRLPPSAQFPHTPDAA